MVSRDETAAAAVSRGPARGGEEPFRQTMEAGCLEGKSFGGKLASGLWRLLLLIGPVGAAVPPRALHAQQTLPHVVGPAHRSP